jgi:hypothetical protein
MFWKICFGVMLLSLSGFVGYVYAEIGSIRDILKSMIGVVYVLSRNLMPGLANKEVVIRLQNINQTLKTINSELPQLLENMRRIAATIKQISESRMMQLMAPHRQGVVEPVNPNTVKMDMKG